MGPQLLQTITLYTKSKMEVFRNKSFTEIARAQQHKEYSICAISISKSSAFMSDITLHGRSDSVDFLESSIDSVNCNCYIIP